MTQRDSIQTRVASHLAALVRSPEGRPVGSAANHAAEDSIAGALLAAGYDVERQGFDCVEWHAAGVELRLAASELAARVNPYSPACDLVAPAVAVSSVGKLEASELAGRIALLHGPLTAEPLFPRNFPFFTVEEHQQVVDLLEEKGARAVIAVGHTANPAPVIEDGDFTVPSVTVPADVGALLLAAEGAPIALRIRATSRPGRGANVIGRLAHPSRDKIVLCAHFDTKPGTPGALDNAAGVAAVLALAEELAAGPPTNVEVVAFNGEDHYASPGQVAYLAGCGGDFGRIALVVNIDGVGLRQAATTMAFFGCPEAWADAARAEMNRRTGLEEAAPWPQGDHSLFAMRGVPCVALTSAGIHDLIDRIIHTPADTLDILDPIRIAETVGFLNHLLTHLGPPTR